MAHTRRSGLLVAASLVAAAGTACSLSSARAQDSANAPGVTATTSAGAQAPAGATSADPAQPSAGPTPASAGAAAPAEARLPIRFNFKDAPFDQVIDFFSRESGLPVIREVDPPQGGMTFISDRAYTFDEALSILNLNLTPRGMQLRRDANFLFLATLRDSARKAGAVVQGQVPSGVAPETIVNLTLALRNAQADRVAEQIRPLIAEYGSVTSVPAQNMVIVVETAAQARRIAEIVAAIDDVRPVDSAYRLFPLRHAKAEPVFQALRGLLGERTRQVFIDKDGRQTVTQDVTVAGLNLQPDTRTNAIIAVGSASRIQTVEELVRLLDVPEPDSQTRMATFTLEAVRPEQAAERLGALFEPVERSRRPTVITLGEAGKLVIVGGEAHLAMARSLLAEIDPQVRESHAGAAGEGAATPAAPARRTATVRLTFITPAALERIAPRLLTPRQQQVVRFAPTPDDRGVVISGPDAEVAAMERLIATLDVAPDAPKDVRTLRVDRGDPAAVLQRAQELYKAAGRSEVEPVSASLDAGTRQVTLVGPRAGVDRFSSILASVQASVATPREMRTFMLSRARPSQAALELQRLLRAVLAPGDGSEFVEPQLEASDELRTLVVRATAGQWEAIQRLVAQVDESRPELATAVLRLRSAEAGAASQAIARALQAAQGAGPAASVTPEPSGNSIVVIGTPAQVDRARELLAQLDVPAAARDASVARTFRLRTARAEAVAPVLEALIGRPSVATLLPSWQVWSYLERTGGRLGEEVKVAADRASNAVVVTAPAAVLEVAEQIVAELDRAPEVDRPAQAIRVLPLRNAEASELSGSIEAMLRDTFLGQEPAVVRVDRASNTLIVRGSAEQLAAIEGVVEKVDAATLAGSRQLRFVPVDRSRTDARSLAEALGRLSERQGGARVRVVSIDELLKGQGQSDQPDPRAPVPAPDAAPEPAPTPRGDAGHAPLPWWARAVAELAVAQPAPARADAPGEPEPEVTIAIDPATNQLVIVGPPRAAERLSALAAQLQQQMPAEPTRVRVVELPQGADANAVAAVVRQTVDRLGRQSPQNPGGFSGAVSVASDPSGSALVVWSNDTDFAPVAELVRALMQLDGPEARTLPVRVMKLERADASSVAQSLTRFFADRASASSTPGRRVPVRVAVSGDRASGTLVVAASEEDFESVRTLVATLDAPRRTREMQYRVVPLTHARVTDLAETIQNLSWELSMERRGGWWGRPPSEPEADKLFVQTNERLNAFVLLGQGDSIEAAAKVIAELDKPLPEGDRPEVRAVVAPRGDLGALAELARRSTATPNWPWWRGQDPDVVSVQVDASRRTLLLVGKPGRVALAAEALEKAIAALAPSTEALLRTLTLRHAPAGRAAETLRRALAESAAAAGRAADQVSIVPSTDGNALLITADEAGHARVRELLETIDQPELGRDRRVEVLTLKNRQAAEIALAVRAQFPSGRAESQVIVSAQPGTNMLVVSARAEDLPEIRDLVRQLDVPAGGDSARLVSVPLKSARAEEVARALSGALPEGIKLRITPVRRTNTLLLTGSEETIALAREQIARLDVEVERPTVEFRRIVLRHAVASEVAFTLDQMLRSRPPGPGEPMASVDWTPRDNTIAISGTADQVRDLEAMVAQLDMPAESARKVEFVKLQFARAEQAARALAVFYGRFAPEAQTPGARRVSIVPDPASNSLVIAADEQEWEGVRALLRKLDTAEYDTSRHLSVIPLKHADAASVARALNEGLRAPVQERLVREQARRQQGGNRRPDENELPTVLVDSEPTPTVAAEPVTNSLVVFAGRNDTERIRSLVQTIDVPDFQRLPQAHVLPLTSGKASQVAAAVRELYQGQTRGVGGARSVVIVADDTSNSLIVRAEERELAQIRALAETLQQQGDASRTTVRILPLSHIPAPRLQRTIAQTFSAAARQHNEPLAVEVDRAANALVVASTGRMFTEIQRVVRELDDAAGAGKAGPEIREVPAGARPGAAILIIDVTNNAPEDVRRQLEQLGVTQPAREDRPAVLGEPVTIVPLSSRRALAIVASASDAEAVASLVRAVDATPPAPDQEVAMVGLRMASAPAVAATLRQMLNPGDQAAQTGPARALAEQVRRLSIAGNALNQAESKVDLSLPIRVIADAPSNTLIIASTAANVAALREVVRTLDALPIGDAVVVRMFPLSNSSAARSKAVIDDLFRQGEELRRLPGTTRQGLPTTATGRALAGEIAVAVDERTNTLIVAGREEAVALVEVLMKDLDGDQAARWVEPALVPLKHADAARLAATLRQVLVQGAPGTPEAAGLQRQFGRLRMLRAGRDLADPEARIEADLFAPISGLFITPEPNLNALIVVGSGANVAVVRELVVMLDVPAASAANTVRTYPLVNAAADRVADVLAEVFEQRQRDPSARPEDRLSVTPDLRTNSIIVSTSPRSFGILESLLKTLDSSQAAATVGLHVIPVGNADAAALSPKIDRLMRDRLAASRRAGQVTSPTDVFSIEADAVAGVLIVAASEENLRLVRELVEQFTAQTQARGEATRNDIVPVKAGRASELAATIRQLYADRENAKRGSGSVGVLANERLNALVISGTEEDLAAMRRLAESLEAAPVVTQQEIRRFGLRAANAIEVVQLVQNVLAGRAVSGGADVSARQATTLRFFRERVAAALDERGEFTEAQIDNVIREQITLTPELRTNSVMVKAPAPLMALITDIIEDLDTTSAGARRIEQFRLRNADVRQMADLLRDIFTLRQRGSTFVLVPTPVEPTVGEGQQPPSGGALTPVPDERQELSIAIDARTNTLIVSGTEEYLRRVREVVEDLDSIEASERVSRVYAVRNARAKEIETTLQAYFRGESQLQRQLLNPEQAGAVMRQLEQEVTIVGDEKSNKLVISTSPRYLEMVLEMVRELDAAPPQVMIQVLLAEVTVDARQQWGADFRMRNVGGDQFNLGFLTAGAGVAAALGVPNLSFSSTDFELVLRALQAQGRLQVLSSPHLTARNNEQASINVGENIAIVQGTERTPQGSIRADVNREDVGIKLNVTPSVSPDGFVRMEIEPEISTLSSRTTQISEDFVAPIINRRQLRTTITVKDGQTVVLGGLIQSQNDQRRSKVPLLGDFPLVGWAFRSRDVSDVRTELLVILTPRVLYSDGPHAAGLFERYSDQRIDDLTDPDSIRREMESNGMRALEREPREKRPWPPPIAEPDAPAPVHAPPPADRPRAADPFRGETFRPSRSVPAAKSDHERPSDEQEPPITRRPWRW